jgi:hypothetical protein
VSTLLGKPIRPASDFAEGSQTDKKPISNFGTSIPISKSQNFDINVQVLKIVYQGFVTSMSKQLNFDIAAPRRDHKIEVLFDFEAFEVDIVMSRYKQGRGYQQFFWMGWRIRSRVVSKALTDYLAA